MLTLEDIQARLEPMNIQAVAKATRLHPNTVYRVANNVGSPLYTVIKRLSDYMESQSK